MRRLEFGPGLGCVIHGIPHGKHRRISAWFEADGRLIDLEVFRFGKMVRHGQQAREDAKLAWRITGGSKGGAR